MVIRQIKEKHWESIYRQITTNGRAALLSLQFDVDIICNGVTYIVKVQPERNRKIAVLQATGIYPGCGGAGGNNYELIEDNLVLSALLEIIIYQAQGGTHQKKRRTNTEISAQEKQKHPEA